MKITKTNIDDLLIIEPRVWEDERGYFFESYKESFFEDFDLDYNWIQDNEALSSRGVLRGLHYQTAPHGQAKLVRVAIGEVLDIVVDLRPESTSYGHSFSMLLSGENKKQLLVPRGFAHGYVVLSPKALFMYKVDQPYNPAAEAGIMYNDETLGLEWIIPNDELVVSAKDANLPSFKSHIPYHGT